MILSTYQFNPTCWVESTHKKCLEEGIYIVNSEADYLLNSRSEYLQTAVRRVITTREVRENGSWGKFYFRTEFFINLCFVRTKQALALKSESNFTIKLKFLSQ